MRVFGIFTALTALVSIIAAAPTSCDTELPCDVALSVSLEGRSLGGIGGLPNSARIKLGLPLRAPYRRSPGAPARRDGASATPTTHEPTSTPTPDPTPDPTPEPTLFTKRGIIRVDRADGSGTVGYLSAHPFNGAQHRYQSIDNAMIVSFTVPDDTDTTSQIEINTENSDIQSTFPRLSLVQGRDNTNSNLASGSYHYAYVAGSASTAPGATPQNVPNSYTAATSSQRTAESAVWTYDPVTQKITVTWINTDGGMAPTTLFTQSTALYVGGDPAAFNSRYPSPVILVTYTFIPL